MWILSARHGASSSCGWGVAVNILNKQSRKADKGWSSNLGLGEGLTTPYIKNTARYGTLLRFSELDRFFVSG
jgi:hypothetical protein